ncbi:hypothetical protein CHS0354_007374 [Potamilus streckersoni]|uniref:Uncharacterized protein n=1 Tax=Potamilus streckersoni TaxID=2493646 RepID=A0AAE0WDY2_9BIVA|nr:hypothetical protein CHS0354_007374 [Potamilus streckersoni]
MTTATRQLISGRNFKLRQRNFFGQKQRSRRMSLLKSHPEENFQVKEWYQSLDDIDSLYMEQSEERLTLSKLIRYEILLNKALKQSLTIHMATSDIAIQNASQL